MSKKKIMTVLDLYNFCVKNNFCHFSSATNNEEICVQMPAIFEKEEKVDKDKEGLTPFVAKAYHDHINLNKSEIKPEVLESTLPSAMLRPILASIVVDEETGEKDFGSHDFVFEEDEDGNERIRYIEQPVGVIFGDNTIEYDEEDGVNRAILHGYLYDGYCQDAVDIMNRRQTVDCSVELSIREMSFNAADKILTLDDFYVSGLTLLNSKVNPGMKGSQVTIADFSKENNSMFSESDKLVEVLEKLNTTLSNFQIDNNQGKEDTDVELEKFEEVVEEVTETIEEVVDEVTEEVAEESTEEVTVTEEMSEETTEVTPEVVVEEVEEVAEQFEDKMVRTFEISHEDLRYALYNLLGSFEEIDNDWYWISNVYDEYFVYENWDGTKIYRQNYLKDGDNVSFDGERVELFKEYLTASEKAELEAMRSNYSAISEKLAKYEAEPAKMEVINSESYAKIADTKEFAELRDNHFDLTVEEVSAKADEILLAYAKGGSINFSAEPEKKSVSMIELPINAKANKKSRYGSLFSK